MWPGLVTSEGVNQEELKEEVTPVVSATGRKGLRAWFDIVWFDLDLHDFFSLNPGEMSDLFFDIICGVYWPSLLWLYIVQCTVGVREKSIHVGIRLHSILTPDTFLLRLTNQTPTHWMFCVSDLSQTL